jgi:chromosome segregation ATPase
MATAPTATASSTSTASNAGDGNELLDLRDTESSEHDGTAADLGSSNGSGSDAAANTAEPAHAPGGDGLSEALKAERRRSNQLEKELRGLRQQLTRFSEINPEEYARLQEADRQKQLLEQQLELRERQMEEAAAKRVAAVSAERDAAHERVQELRKERLLERAFSEAEGRTGGDSRGTFFQVFRSMARANRCWGMTAGR